MKEINENPLRTEYQEYLKRLGYSPALIKKAWKKIYELHPEEAEFTKEVICRDLLRKTILGVEIK